MRNKIHILFLVLIISLLVIGTLNFGTLKSNQQDLSLVQSAPDRLLVKYKKYRQESQQDLVQNEIESAYGLQRQKHFKFIDDISYCEKELVSNTPGWVINNMMNYNFPFLRDVLARAYQQNGEIEKAIAEYERLTTFDPDSRDRLLVHPKNYYRLAKLYEQQGDTAKAIEHYEKFLDLWKDADPGIADVEDARQRLAGLKGE